MFPLLSGGVLRFRRSSNLFFAVLRLLYDEGPSGQSIGDVQPQQPWVSTTLTPACYSNRKMRLAEHERVKALFAQCGVDLHNADIVRGWALDLMKQKVADRVDAFSFTLIYGVWCTNAFFHGSFHKFRGIFHLHGRWKLETFRENYSLAYWKGV